MVNKERTMFTKTFTDPQGQTHTNAVFETAEANYSDNQAEDYRFDIAQGDSDSSKTSNSSSGNYLRYKMYYWTSQAARDASMLPYILASVSPVGQWFTASDIDASYDGLPAALKAEKHAEFVILV